MRDNFAKAFLLALKGGAESLWIVSNGANIEHGNDLVV